MKKYFFLFILLICQFGCKKYLNEKPNKSLALPKDNLDNLQLVLNDTHTMNQQSASAGEIGTDNFYFTDAQFQSISQSQPTSGNLYIWNRNLFNESDNNDWTLTYKVIFNTNLVLDGLKQISPSSASQSQWNSIKGQALFFRAYAFYQLLQEFAKPYDKSTSSSDPGIAIRLTADVSEKSARSSVQQSYDQCIKDLAEAINLLPVKLQFKTNPNKAAAIGLLARTYLIMGNYDMSLQYATQYLKLDSTLLDFNTLPSSASYPISRYNVEVAFHTTLFQLTAYSSSYARVNDSLLTMYDVNDLRKSIFFKNGGAGNVTFKGSYDGSRVCFSGIATDEIYLIAAECNARIGKITEAMTELNGLLITRWKANTFIPFTANDMASALQIILTERRKELLFRNLRWADLRRLNKESNFQKILSRNVNGQIYTLIPNDNHYVLPLPNKVIQLSGMAQN